MELAPLSIVTSDGRQLAEIHVVPTTTVREIKIELILSRGHVFVEPALDGRVWASAPEEATHDASAIHYTIDLNFGDTVLLDSSFVESYGIRQGSTVRAMFFDEQILWENTLTELQHRKELNRALRQSLRDDESSQLDSAMVAELRAVAETLSTNAFRPHFERALQLLSQGSGTSSFRDCRELVWISVDPLDSCHDMRGDGFNLAYLFCAIVTYIEHLSGRGLHDEATSLATLATELFESMVIASGDGLLRNELGIAASSSIVWGGAEVLLGNITSLCRRDLFRLGVLPDVRSLSKYRWPASAGYNKEALPEIHSIEALRFSWRVFELQTLSDCHCSGGPPQVKRHWLYERYAPLVSFLDLFYIVPGGMMSPLPPLVSYLRQKAMRLVLPRLLGPEQLAEDCRQWMDLHERHRDRYVKHNYPLDMAFLFRAIETHSSRLKLDPQLVEMDQERMLETMPDVIDEVLRSRLLERSILDPSSEGFKEINAVAARLCTTTAWAIAKKYPDVIRTCSSSDCCCVGPDSTLHWRIVLKHCPEFLFEHARRRNRRMLQFFLHTEPAVLRMVGSMSHPRTGVDLLTWTCGQRGLTHQIVGALLKSGAFVACGQSPCTACTSTGHDGDVVVAARRAALLAAKSVRNQRVCELLSEAW
eukprot:CAMPEP_0117529156 /NCGR_PEP_ID=MMETSP0784-20121206/37688_1 /TAXON_ID=39447 /ORGANISM="" /LENGTH=647 /DNA_ID=CAMNT_0005325471 /DNA_START=31 /DNA_END=1971 /DNA_ORIENTATION=-